MKSKTNRWTIQVATAEPHSKAQGSMEYLMTYGWAILIISVALGALFSLGVFGGVLLVGNSCAASPGYYCSGLSYSHLTGNVVVTVGQATGVNWASTAFLYAPTNAAMTANAPSVMFANVISIGLVTGTTNTIAFPVASAPVPLGATTSGEIWACYTTATGSSVTANIGFCTSSATVYYTQIASMNAKAT